MAHLPWVTSRPSSTLPDTSSNDITLSAIISVGWLLRIGAATRTRQVIRRSLSEELRTPQWRWESNGRTVSVYAITWKRYPSAWCKGADQGPSEGVKILVMARRKQPRVSSTTGRIHDPRYRSSFQIPQAAPSTFKYPEYPPEYWFT